MILEITLSIVLFCILWELTIRWIEPRNLPPGLRIFPFRAILSRSNDPPHERLFNMAQIYGDVFSIKQGRQITVIINSFSAAKEALAQKRNDFAGRPSSHAGILVTKGGKSIVVGDFAPMWTLHRRMVQSALCVYCEYTTLEDKICSEADHLIGRFQDAMKEPFDPKYKVYLAVVNVMCAIVFGNRYELNEPEFYEIVELNNRLRRISTYGDILDRFPWLKYFPLELMNDINEAIGFRDRLCSRKLQEHRSTFSEDSIRDLTDALLKRISDTDSMTDNHLIVTMMDFFSTAADKISASICWALAYIITHPEVQVKVHQELDNVIEKDRPPNLTDISRLPYLAAVINETIRLSPPTPLGIPHCSVIETTLQGFNIPKHSSVIINFWAIQRDPRHWNDPTEFKPERFLDEDGHLVLPSSVSYLPFGAGPRACLGETLAKTELFLFLSRLLHQFKFNVPPGCNPPDMKGTTTTVLEPKPFRFLATRR